MWDELKQLDKFIKEHIVDYIDIDYSLWMTWCLTPLLITFLLPAVIALLLYLTAFMLYIYKLHWRNIRHTLESGDRWDAARKLISAIWDAHGWLWHGYEVQGLENIPNTGPALIIYYHGAIPIDLYYFLAKVMLYRNRLIHTVVDYFLFKIPGFGVLAECVKAIPGTVQTCSTVLKENNLLAISPGGVYEAQFSHHYDLMWKKRLGFAKVALEAKAELEKVISHLEVEKIKLTELLEIQNKRLKDERDSHDKTQLLLKMEKQASAKFEANLARIEFESKSYTSLSGYSTSSQANLKALQTYKNELELANENIKVLKTRLEIEQQEKKIDFQKFLKILGEFQANFIEK